MRARRALAVGALLGAVALLRRGSVRSGVSDQECRVALPGDELVRKPMWQATRGITIDRPASVIWPWLVQMGYPTLRGGWYTPHWLDRTVWRIRAKSADEIRPELQTLEVGDRVPDSADWSAFFTVTSIERPEALVMHSTRHKLPPVRKVDFSWAFVLRELAQSRTRLLIRARASYAPRWTRVVVAPVVGPADWINVAAMLRGIKRRAERTQSTASESVAIESVVPPPISR